MPHNPFAGVRVTGTWEDHGSYSAGGTDLPLGYETPIPAPAAGTLRTSGGSGEFAAGWVGSAGRRSILTLDNPLPRLSTRRTYPNEGEGPMVALVLQHQAAFKTEGWYPEGAICGVSGASANGRDWGGDVHLHWHGLNARGQRLRVESFITATTPAGGGATPIPLPTPPKSEEDEDMPKNSGVYYDKKNPDTGKTTTIYLLFNTGSGWSHEFSNGEGNGPMPAVYNNALAGALDTGSWAPVTAGHAGVIKASLAAVLASR